MKRGIWLILGFVVLVFSLSSCSREVSESGKSKKTIVIGLIAKSQSNPVFQAARVGAEDAAVERGIPVVCFDSDAPDSKRFAYHGVDDVACGKRVTEELARAMGGKGVIAILAGNQNAPNLQKRVKGVKEGLKEYPEIKLKGVYYHKETPQDATAKVEEVQNANPEITGWAMVGGWPLFTDALLKWEPGKVKIVAVDALPAQLPYVEKGVAQVLLAQQVYKWGYRSVELLIDKILFDKQPLSVRDISELIPVTRENVKEFGANWKTWLRQG